MAVSLTVTFEQDPDDLYGLLDMVKELIEEEYDNGGFDGFKPTAQIVDEDE